MLNNNIGNRISIYLAIYQGRKKTPPECSMSNIQPGLNVRCQTYIPFLNTYSELRTFLFTIYYDIVKKLFDFQGTLAKA